MQGKRENVLGTGHGLRSKFSSLFLYYTSKKDDRRIYKTKAKRKETTITITTITPCEFACFFARKSRGDWDNCEGCAVSISFLTRQRGRRYPHHGSHLLFCHEHPAKQAHKQQPHRSRIDHSLRASFTTTTIQKQPSRSKIAKTTSQQANALFLYPAQCSGFPSHVLTRTVCSSCFPYLAHARVDVCDQLLPSARIPPLRLPQARSIANGTRQTTSPNCSPTTQQATKYLR